jgi:hypothetical protein
MTGFTAQSLLPTPWGIDLGNMSAILALLTEGDI